MENPNQSPQSTVEFYAESAITDDHVARLIDGTDVETCGIGDVSLVELYGRKHRRRLTGSLAASAETAGCDPVVYQSVRWWCIAFLPVVPRGVYYVMPLAEGDVFDTSYYRLIPAPWDSSQVSLHCFVALISLLVLVGGLGSWWWWR